MSIEEGDEYADVYNGEWRRARKEHRCVACKEKIQPRDRHFYVFWIFEGEPYMLRRCARCQTLYEHLYAIVPDGQSVDDELNCGHSYEEIHGRSPPPEIAALAFALPRDFS